MTTPAEAQAELDRIRAQFGKPPTRVDDVTKWLKQQMATYRDALRAIASGELTKNKAVQAAATALEKGETYRVLILRAEEARSVGATPSTAAKEKPVAVAPHSC